MGECNFDLETALILKGHSIIAGVDEAGMGCLAGPVVASAVILQSTRIPKGINDSKLLTPKIRERLSAEIKEAAKAFAIAMASVEEIDTINIYHAGRLAMVRALNSLSLVPSYVLADGKGKLQTQIPYEMIVGGDRKSVSVGAASILAKVHRDSLMRDLDQKFPGYDFALHKGYGSEHHRRRLEALGRSPIHRKSFTWTPVREVC